MKEPLEPMTRELIGVAAAVAGHCQPCFAYHYVEALKLGASVQAVEAAVELARSIRRAGDQHMDEFVVRRMASGRLSPSTTSDLTERQ